jgi:hypothetical protein
MGNMVPSIYPEIEIPIFILKLKDMTATGTFQLQTEENWFRWATKKMPRTN